MRDFYLCAYFKYIYISAFLNSFIFFNNLVNIFEKYLKDVKVRI